MKKTNSANLNEDKEFPVCWRFTGLVRVKANNKLGVGWGGWGRKERTSDH